MDTLRWAAALLAPGTAIFTLRALLDVAGREPSAVPGLDIATGAGGALSLIGLALAVAALRMAAVAGAACILMGHFAISDYAPELGAGLVYLGTGLLVARAWPQAAAAGGLAMAGALVRSALPAGHGVVALGAAWLTVVLVQAVRGPGATGRFGRT